jgi:hypothetical protein
VVYVDKPQVVPSQQHPAPFFARAAADGPDSHEDIVRPATTHVMQLTGAVAGAMARVLFDSEAEHEKHLRIVCSDGSSTWYLHGASPNASDVDMSTSDITAARGIVHLPTNPAGCIRTLL